MYEHKRKSMNAKSELPQSAGAMIMLNVGAGLDIPRGTFIPGKHGEHMLNGGLPIASGMAGKGNSWKTTIMEWQMARAAGRTSFDFDTDITSYDTEENKDHNRILDLLQKSCPEFAERDLFAEGLYTITGKSDLYADKWFAKLKTFLEDKAKNKKSHMQPTPFLSANKRDLVEIMQPTFSLVDSFSEFESSDVAKMLEDTEIGQKEGNTLYIKQGSGKTRFLMEYPAVGVGNQHYLLTAMHYGKIGPQLNAGPHTPPPEKKLDSLKLEMEVKGAPPKYYYLIHWLGLSDGAKMLLNKDRMVDYPEDVDDKRVGDSDLWIIPVKTLRSKSGPSSWSVEIIGSQRDGIQPGLTEFHMLRTSRFGLVGNDQNYCLAIYPDERLSRSVIRGKINANSTLRRAVNITSELYQMSLYHRGARDGLMDGEELFAKIKERGYNWEMILNKTRGWWKPNNDIHPLLPLSTRDLINMANGRYHPYWLEADKQTIKSKYILDMPYAFH